MKVYRFLPTAREAIEDAGLTQTAIAEAAGIDRHHFNKRLNGAGSFMPATANRIARAFAEQTHTEKPAAMRLLFEVFDDGREAKRRAEAHDAAD
jgi:transcriptional regulator with XRE-family HTH domain